MMDPKKFGCFIQTRRKELGMTQSQLADRLGVTDKAVSRWERGVGFPDISLLEPLAQALELTVVELMRSERTGEDPVPAEAADRAVLHTLDLAEEQQRNLWRSRLLTFGLIPAVLALDLFLSTVIDRYVQAPEWLRVLSIGTVSWFVVFCVMGIRYIASCRYAVGTKRRLPLKFWIITAVTCAGVAIIGFSACISGPKPRWLSLLTVVALMLAMASPFYLYHLITDEIRDWNRWNGGRDF